MITEPSPDSSNIDFTRNDGNFNSNAHHALRNNHVLETDKAVSSADFPDLGQDEVGMLGKHKSGQSQGAGTRTSRMIYGSSSECWEYIMNVDPYVMSPSLTN